MNHLALIGPPHVTAPRTQAAQRIHRIGRGKPTSPVVVSFDPADQRACRDLLAWFERGGQRGATLLIDDWKLCEESDSGLTAAVRWIAATAKDVQVIITARTLADLPKRVRPLARIELLHFLALQGKPSGYDVIAPGNRRAEGISAVVLPELATNSPDSFQVLFIDFHGTGVFAGLDQAPHVYGSFSRLADDQALADRVCEALKGEAALREELLKNGNFKTVYQYRRAYENQAPLDPLPNLLVCVDGLDDLVERYPGFQEPLQQLASMAKTWGTHLLRSAAETPDGRTDHRLELAEEGWHWQAHAEEPVPITLPADLAEVAATLPAALADGEAIRDQILLAPLHQREITLDMVAGVLPPGAIVMGLIDRPFEHRTDIWFADFRTRRHGAIVGKPGSGRTHALQVLHKALVGAFGSADGYRLLDGPLPDRAEAQHVVVTAETWDQVPQFVRDDLALGIELKLADPAGSVVGERQAANVPDRPGLGLCTIAGQHVLVAGS